MDLLKLVGALAVGYGACRYMEAKAHEVPLEMALRDPFVSTLILRAQIDAALQAQAAAAKKGKNGDGLAGFGRRAMVPAAGMHRQGRRW
jgi:hypothetical protein